MENVVTNTQIHEYSLMRYCLLTCLVWIFLMTSKIYGQNVPMQKKAREQFDKAQKAFQDRQLNEAALLFEKVLQTEPKNAESHLRLAQIYDLLRNNALSKHHYLNLVAIQPQAPQSASAYQWLGKSYFQSEKYDSALVYYQKAMELFPAKSNLSKLAEKSVITTKFAREAVKKPLQISKRSLGDTVNFLNAQYFPVLTADGETLIFTGLTENREENIYITHRQDKGWDVPEEISSAINTTNNEGTCSVSADGRTLVFTACNRQDGYGSCDLYITKKDGKDWSAPVNMGDVINSRN